MSCSGERERGGGGGERGNFGTEMGWCGRERWRVRDEIGAGGRQTRADHTKSGWKEGFKELND